MFENYREKNVSFLRVLHWQTFEFFSMVSVIAIYIHSICGHPSASAYLCFIAGTPTWDLHKPSPGLHCPVTIPWHPFSLHQSVFYESLVQCFISFLTSISVSPSSMSGHARSAADSSGLRAETFFINIANITTTINIKLFFEQYLCHHIDLVNDRILGTFVVLSLPL